MFADFTYLVIFIVFLSLWVLSSWVSDFFSDFLIDYAFLQQLINLQLSLIFWGLFLCFAGIYQRFYSRAKSVIFLWYHTCLSIPGKSVRPLHSGKSSYSSLRTGSSNLSYSYKIFGTFPAYRSLVITYSFAVDVPCLTLWSFSLCIFSVVFNGEVKAITMHMSGAFSLHSTLLTGMFVFKFQLPQ